MKSFVIPDHLASSLELIGDEYGKMIGQRLLPIKKSSLLRACGAKDLLTRFQQNQNIQKWLQVLKFKLKPVEYFPHDHNQFSEEMRLEFNEHMCAQRILTTIALFHRAKINPNGLWEPKNNPTVFEGLLLQALELNYYNTFNRLERLAYLRFTLQFIQNNSFDELNRAHRLSPPFTIEEWTELTNFLENEIKKLSNDKTAHPVAETTASVVGTAGYAVGVSTGWLLGEFASKSSSLVPLNVHLSGVITAVICAFGNFGAAIAALFVSMPISQKLVKNVSCVSLAAVLGCILSNLCYGAGYSAGYTVEKLYGLLYEACSYLSHLGEEEIKVSGYHYDGTRVDANPNIYNVRLEIEHKQLYLIVEEKGTTNFDKMLINEATMHSLAQKYPLFSAQLANYSKINPDLFFFEPGTIKPLEVQEQKNIRSSSLGLFGTKIVENYCPNELPKVLELDDSDDEREIIPITHPNYFSIKEQTLFAPTLAKTLLIENGEDHPDSKINQLS